MRQALVALLLLLAACTDGGGGSAPPTTVTISPDSAATAATAAPQSSPSPTGTESDAVGTRPDPTDAPQASPSPTAVADATTDQVAGAAVQLVELARLDAPIALATRSGESTLYVAERAGRLRTIADGQVGDVILDLSDITTTGGERGLLGIAWSPDGQLLYTSFTDRDGTSVLMEVPAGPGGLEPAAARELLRVPQPASNHNGGDVHVTADGLLWWTLGDGGAADDRFDNGQDPATLLGTIVRIDPNTGDPYGIPAGNPFAGGQGGAPEVWAYGLRNPWRISFDAGQLWIADVGQDRVEEINRISVEEGPGANFGWSYFEGDQPFDGPNEGPPPDDVVFPVHTYPTSRGCAVTGGVVYRGAAITDLHGAYLFSDYCEGGIRALSAAGDEVELGLAAEDVVSFGTGPDAEVYVLSLAGPLYRMEPA